MSVHNFAAAAEHRPFHFLERKTPEERIEWALKEHSGRAVATTSFGIQSAVLLHMVTNIAPHLPVVFVDTGYLFPETYAFAQKLQDRLALNLQVYSAKRTPAMQEALEGRRWEQGGDALKAFNYETKVEPLNRALSDLGATGWLSGLRRGQNDRRETLDAAEIRKGVVKVYPLIDMTSRDVFNYLKAHNLPYHPLFEKGYSTVGNWFENAPGQGRQECGIHVQ